MSLYEAVESALVLRLADHLRGVRIEAFPDDANELGKAAPVRRILIGYQSSNFDFLSENPELVIRETLTFEATVGVKGLRSHTGVYTLLEGIRRSLTGFIPVQAPNARKMRPTGLSYKGIEEGIWYYSATFTFDITYGEFDTYGQEFQPLLEPVVLPNEITITAGIWRSLVDSLRIDPALDTQFNITPGDTYGDP